MNNIFYMEDSFVIASIMYTKNLHFLEKFVTYKELNYIRNKLQNRFNIKNENVLIINNIDRNYFVTDEVILLNKENDIDMNRLVTRYQEYCYSINVLLLLWDDDFIYNELVNLKKEEMESLLAISNIKKKKIILE